MARRPQRFPDLTKETMRAVRMTCSMKSPAGVADGEVVGWCHGRMDFGPRALGNRSILADPRSARMREHVNAAVKKRESFRPFAPAVLAHRANDHFNLDHFAPFMLETCQVRSTLQLPAITHVDGSARVQTVDPDTQPRFHRLLEAFERRTGCPILLNTSFNLRGEPIVCTPVDALICFIRSGLDCLVLEDVLVERSGLPDAWTAAFEGTPPRPDGRRRFGLHAAVIDGQRINQHSGSEHADRQSARQRPG